ncbi:3-oxoacyl-ACP synthase III family protein [Streptomyces sp. NPDC058001]|uniref:3-oxoacyl-ACP synthase III family protein n=1 Tax=Streptomyces sp. NPDC058001 TaxID=3346300 RepID=UPI0036E3A03B
MTAQRGPLATGIRGTGSFLPADTVSNGIVAERAGVTAEWIVGKTGIRERRYAAEDEATSDLAVAAAEAALVDAGVEACQLGWIVVATSTPDHPQPATASLVQHRLGAAGAAAFDLNAVCSGFVFALVTVARLVAADAAEEGRYGLVVGADVYSRIIDPSDRRTAVLFGDGAGAVVLGPVRAGYGIVGSDLTTFGRHHDMIEVPAGGSRKPASEKTLASGEHYFQMQGRAVREFVAAELPASIRRLLATCATDPHDVDHLVPHQANGAMLHDVLPGLGLPRARTHLTVAGHANTGAASVPLTLDVARREQRFGDGDILLLAGFGGGMSVGTVLVRWDAAAAPER